MKKYYFLSFRDPKVNKNLGVSIVEADTLDEALRVSWSNKCNPGGEVSFAKITEDEMKENNLESNRLYSKADMEARGYATIRDQNKLREN